LLTKGRGQRLVMEIVLVGGSQVCPAVPVVPAAVAAPVILVPVVQVPVAPTVLVPAVLIPVDGDCQNFLLS
jgi:hypothetical protein